MTAQGTVLDYDETSRCGSVVLDDGRRLSFASDAVDSSVRLLRGGQRVRLDVDDHEVRRVRLLTVG